MPTRQNQTATGTRQAMKNTAYESIVKGWLMQDEWQVFSPELDHGHQTDILISDGCKYHRIQVKTVEAKGADHNIKKMWKDEHPIDVVVYFVRNSSWGIVARAFKENKRPLDHPEHIKFNSFSQKEFLTAFHAIPNG